MRDAGTVSGGRTHRRGGEIVVVFRTRGLALWRPVGHARHGRVSATAAGRWSDPIELAPRGDDVRNPALGIAPDGRWLVAYWRAGVRCYPMDASAGERRWRLPGVEYR